MNIYDAPLVAAMCRERARKQAEARQARRPKAQEALRRVGPGRLQRAAAMGPVVHELLRTVTGLPPGNVRLLDCRPGFADGFVEGLKTHG